jgi:soluble lytic murein transglycosylase-like protein
MLTARLNHPTLMQVVHDAREGVVLIARKFLIFMGFSAVSLALFAAMDADFRGQLVKMQGGTGQVDEVSRLADGLSGAVRVPGAAATSMLGLNRDVASAPAAAPAAQPPVAITGGAKPRAANPPVVALPPRQAHDNITRYLAKRYRVSGDAADLLVSAAYLTGSEVGLDPLLILAVMAVESGLNPFAESVMGAQGLMQVMAKVHRDKLEEFGGLRAALNPVANIKVGALILKDYIHRFGGVEPALKAYSGATGDDYGYPNKVIAERDRLRAAGSGKLVYTPAVSAPVPLAQSPALPKVEPNPTPVTQLDTPHPEGV